MTLEGPWGGAVIAATVPHLAPPMLAACRGASVMEAIPRRAERAQKWSLGPALRARRVPRAAVATFAVWEMP